MSGTDQTNEIDEADQRKKWEQSVLAALRPFESLPMVTMIDMSAEAWPGEYTQGEPNHFGLSPKPKELSASVHMLPSLADLTFVLLSIMHFNLAKQTFWDPLIWLPGNPSKIKEILHIDNPLLAVDFALLSKVTPFEVEQTKTIDLSHFSMTGEQVLKLVSAQEGVGFRPLPLVYATDNFTNCFYPTQLMTTCSFAHHIRPRYFLFALREPRIIIESFIHLAFFRPLGEAAFPLVFSHIITLRREVWIAFLPYSTLDQLVQGLTDYYHSCFRDDDNRTFAPECKMLVLAACTSEVRGPGRSWYERIVPFILAI